MTPTAIVLIGFGLALDAFAVSITSGIAIQRLRVRHAMLIAAFFGIFQAVMPLLGWGLGIFTQDLVAAYDHWIAFALLTFVGGKMIYEAFQLQDEKNFNPLNIHILFMLAVATSIDAFAVGLSLSCLRVGIILPAAVIGLITFALSFAGSYIGSFFGHLFENKLEILGGLILVGMGIKILLQHTMSW